jgi:hypothetical protein
MEEKEEATAKAVRRRWRDGDEDLERRGWFWWSIGDGEIGGGGGDPDLEVFVEREKIVVER